MTTQAEKDAARRDEARRHRAANYAVKVDDNFTCTEPGCEAGDGLLVVRFKTVAGGAPVTRCQRHTRGGEIEPYQWNEAPEPAAAAA